MAAMAQLCFSPLPKHYSNATNHRNNNNPSISSFPSSSQTHHFHPFQVQFLNPIFHFRLNLSCNGGSGSGGIGGSGSGGGGGDGGYGDWSGGDSHSDNNNSSKGFGILGLFLNGWRSRVAADPQFPFKVLMEEVVGVSANVLGDMSSRPNFGLNELDFVFSTLVVGSIVNFTLMYLLAPTAGSSSPTLPGLFANCPSSHMFEPGPYGLFSRCGTFVYKGVIFAGVGFAAGLVGTAISNGLIKMRKKMDPSFVSPNKPPPTILNAMTWAIHMGVNSNFRYQALNGLEFSLEKALPPSLFMSSVVGLRCLNNVLGGMTFVMLARTTGSQSAGGEKPAKEDMEKLNIDAAEHLENDHSISK